MKTFNCEMALDDKMEVHPSANESELFFVQFEEDKETQILLSQENVQELVEYLTEWLKKTE